MPKQGEVRVRLCRRWCNAVAGLLEERASRKETPSWLVPEAVIRSNQVMAERLGAVMRKAALRKRAGTGFIVNIDRDLVTFFAGLSIPLRANFNEVFRAQLAFRVAAKSRRGPRRLSGNSLRDRADGKIQRNLEHTLRLRRRLRHERSLEAWGQEIEARGETALTTSIVPPKF